MANHIAIEDQDAVDGATFELCITNAGPYLRKNVLERMCEGANLGGVKYIDKPQQQVHAFIGFATAAYRDAAEATFPTLKSSSDKKFVVRKSTRKIPVHLLQNRPVNPTERGGGRSGQRPEGSSAAAPQSVNEVTAPWLDVPYAVQLSRKHAEMQDALMRFVTKLSEHCTRAGTEAGIVQGQEVSPALASVKGGDDLDDEAAEPASKRARQEEEVEHEGEDVEAGVEEKNDDSAVHSSNVDMSGASKAVSPEVIIHKNLAPASAKIAGAQQKWRPTSTPAVATPGQGAAAPVVRLSKAERWAADSRIPSWLRTILRAHCTVLDAASRASASVSSSTVGSESASSSDGPPSRHPQPFPLPCLLLPIVPSPDTHGYRNKASFTFGVDTAGAACVGFRLGSYHETGTCVAFPRDHPLLPPEMVTVAARVQAWLMHCTLPVYSLGSHSGVWRTLMLRWSASHRRMMVCLTASPPAVGPAVGGDGNGEGDKKGGWRAAYVSELADFVSAICTPFPEGESERFGVGPISLQEYSGPSTPDPNLHPFKALGVNGTVQDVPHGAAEGEGVGVGFRDSLCGKTFEISPNAFFQVNSPAAELLYNIARLLALEGLPALDRISLCTPDPQACTQGHGAFQSLLSLTPSPQPNVALADVCCGTGTIGLVCAPFVGRVVGVDIAEEAIADARVNARLNGTNNAVFIASKAEAVMKDILALAERGQSEAERRGEAGVGGVSIGPPVHITRVVAIVDPPRGGLNPAVVHALRTSHRVHRLVYVSCNPSGSFVEDAMRLCAPQEGKRKSPYARGPAFVLKAAIPLDLFPQTPHTELVALFERE